MMSTASRGDSFGLMMAYAIIFLAVAGLAYVAVSVLNSVALWFACRWLRLPPIGFKAAFQASWLANMVVWVFGGSLLTLAIYRVLVSAAEFASMGRLGAGLSFSYSDAFSPWLLLFILVGAVLTHAAVYVQLCQSEQGERLSFVQASALSLVALALDGLCMAPVMVLLGFVSFWLLA